MSPVPDPFHNQNGNNSQDLNNEIQGFIITGPESSSEEDDQPVSDNIGYQPIPHGPDNLEEDAIDYNSLSGLLSALNTHSPHEINSESPSSERNLQQSSTDEPTSGGSTSSSSNYRPATTVGEEVSSENPKISEYTKEQVSLWNAEGASNKIELDEKKEAEIKAVMSKIVLPNSAIPQWARELSDEQWKNHVVKQIKKEKDS